MMSSFKNYWKVWLQLNLLTMDVDNDYVAEVSLTGKKALRNADIAQMIKDAGLTRNPLMIRFGFLEDWLHRASLRFRARHGMTGFWDGSQNQLEQI